MKKSLKARVISAVAAATLMVCSFAFVVSANDASATSAQNQNKYIFTQGVVTEAEDGRILVGDREQGIVFNLSEDIFVYDSIKNETVTIKDIKIDDNVVAVYKENSPMALSLPPICSACEFLIIVDKEDSVKVDSFTDEFVSADGELKLNLDDESLIINAENEKQQPDAVKDKQAVVLYTVTTKSIPAQTSPSLVVVIGDAVEDAQAETTPKNQESTENSIMDSLTEEQKALCYKVDDTTMLPLRSVAEALGYEVTWTAEGQLITVTFQAASYTLTIGQNEYGYNKSIHTMEIAPQLTNGLTYVPQNVMQAMYEIVA